MLCFPLPLGRVLAVTRADGPVDMTTLARKEQEMGVGRLSALGANLPLGRKKKHQSHRSPSLRVCWSVPPNMNARVIRETGSHSRGSTGHEFSVTEPNKRHRLSKENQVCLFS